MNSILYDVAGVLGNKRDLPTMAEAIESLYPEWIDRITTRDIQEYLKVVK